MVYGLNELLALLLRPGTLSVIAGRPGMGATSLAVQAAKELRSGAVLFFSLDEPASRIRARCGGLDWTINDLGFLTPAMIRDALRKRPDAAAAVVDPLELLCPDSDPNRTREQEFYERTAALRSLAREFDVPILCTASLPRSVEKRSDRRPLLADLADGIGKDALACVDRALFVCRRAYYENTQSSSAELILAKNSFGSTGTVPCQWSLNWDRGTIVFSEAER